MFELRSCTRVVNLLKLFTLMWYYHLWHEVHTKCPCEYILSWSNTVYDDLDHPLFKLIRKTNALSAQHVLLNILQQTWERQIQQIIKFPIYEIKYTKKKKKNTQNLKNNLPNQGKYCTKQLKLFPKTKKSYTRHEKLLSK